MKTLKLIKFNFQRYAVIILEVLDIAVRKCCPKLLRRSAIDTRWKCDFSNVLRLAQPARYCTLFERSTQDCCYGCQRRISFSAVTLNTASKLIFSNFIENTIFYIFPVIALFILVMYVVYCGNEVVSNRRFFSTTSVAKNQWSSLKRVQLHYNDNSLNPF